MDCRFIDWFKILCPTPHKIGHFGDVLPSQSLGVVLKKLNITQQKQMTQEQNTLSKSRKTQENAKPKHTHTN